LLCGKGACANGRPCEKKLVAPRPYKRENLEEERGGRVEAEAWEDAGGQLYSKNQKLALT